jgi:membrane protein involved in colicin uptake
MSRRILVLSLSCFVLVGVVLATAWATRASAPADAAAPSTRLIDSRRGPVLAVDSVLAERAAAADRALAAAQAAAAAEAARAAQAAVALQPRTGVNWDAIARCETGGNWRMQGSRFSGGLGFANTTWTGFGGREFAPNAGMASREQQIVVAERVYDRYGLSGWGCRRFG